MNYQNFLKFFFKKVFFDGQRFKNLISVQHFNSSAFLSRKRMQNYCFTTYPPNTSGTFFIRKCNFFAKSLIFKYAVEHKKVHSIKTSGKLHLIIIYRWETKICRIFFRNFKLTENQVDKVKFPDEVPILDTRHTPDTDYRKAITISETSTRNFIGKPLKINPFEVPEVLKQKTPYLYNM